MPDTPAYDPTLIAAQVESLRAQHALNQLPATATEEEREAARDRARVAAVKLFAHPGQRASQADGKWKLLREAARAVIAEEDGAAGA